MTAAATLAAAAAQPRRTLARPVRVSGVGIHTGARVDVRLVPTESDTPGVVFRVRNGAALAQDIAARASNVADATRCTVLSAGAAGAARVSTVEHLLSALTGTGVTDLIIEVDGPELPIGDGSALLWTNAITEAGLTMIGETIVRPLALSDPLIVYGSKGAFVAAYPSDTLRLTVATQFDHRLAGTQVAHWERGRDDYATNVAPARTFGFDFEIEVLRAAGLARGGSLNNALVVYDDHYSSPLRFDDELARHKLMDLVGDLFLAGSPLLADIVAVRPSHRLNVEMARRLETFADASTLCSEEN